MYYEMECLETLNLCHLGFRNKMLYIFLKTTKYDKYGINTIFLFSFFCDNGSCQSSKSWDSITINTKIQIITNSKHIMRSKATKLSFILYLVAFLRSLHSVFNNVTLVFVKEIILTVKCIFFCLKR